MQRKNLRLNFIWYVVYDFRPEKYKAQQILSEVFSLYGLKSKNCLDEHLKEYSLKSESLLRSRTFKYIARWKEACLISLMSYDNLREYAQNNLA